MGAKKGKKGKKGKKKGGIGDDYTPHEIAQREMAIFNSLQERMCQSAIKAERAKAGDNEKRKKEADNIQIESQTHKDHNDIMADMTR